MEVKVTLFEPHTPCVGDYYIVFIGGVQISTGIALADVGNGSEQQQLQTSCAGKYEWPWMSKFDMVMEMLLNFYYI